MRILRRLIWVYIVCPDLTILLIRINTVNCPSDTVYCRSLNQIQSGFDDFLVYLSAVLGFLFYLRDECLAMDCLKSSDKP